jgi:hypothetical protein
VGNLIDVVGKLLEVGSRAMSALGIHWWAAIGLLLVFLGSGAQALNELWPYKRELQLWRDEFRQDVRDQDARGAKQTLTPIGTMTRATLKLWEYSRTLDGNDPDRAARIRKSIVSSGVWAIIMIGAFAVFVSSALQLVSDYTS